MTITKLINKLEKIKSEFGDLTCLEEHWEKGEYSWTYRKPSVHVIDVNTDFNFQTIIPKEEWNKQFDEQFVEKFVRL